MRRLDGKQGELLLVAARAAISEELGGPRLELIADEPWLSDVGAVFVTLRKGEELRGCIGSPRARRGLLDDVVENAKAAAFEDPRFPPLSSAELEEVSLELSVLTPMEPLEAQTEEEVLQKLKPGVHGVHLQWGGRVGLFIPKMWEQLEDPREFLHYLKRKAGLPPSQWMPGTRVSVFEAQLFEEEDESSGKVLAQA